MQKKMISSNHLPQNRELQKFEIPQRKSSQNYFTQQQHSSHSSRKHISNKLQKIICQKISEVENQNKKLLEIAVKVNSSSSQFQDDDNLHPIIYTIEEQMKSAFNQLIQSIQQFYIDIDAKIKEIGAYLASLSGVDTLQTSKNHHEDFFLLTNQQQKQSLLQSQQQTLRSISNKIQMLQKDLQQTKANESKLMTIIQKLVSKYQLTHETTIVKEDPFLKKKIQNLAVKLQRDEQKSRNIDLSNIIQQLSSADNTQKFMEGNTFAKTSNHPLNQSQHNQQSAKGPFQVPNAMKKGYHPQRNVHNNHHPNDYSICHQLNKLQDNISQKLAHNNPNFKSCISTASLQNQLIQKMKSKLQPFQEKYGASTVSVTSYAYSNPVSQPEEDQCFIKKLYSKQQPTLNKVSLKSCNNSGNNSFFQYKPKEQSIDQRNKNHRQAYLITQLKRQN